MKALVTLLALSSALSGCGPQRLFYYPNRNLYNDPDQLGIPAEVVTYPSANGKTLTALYFKTGETPLGTVVHFHGNFGNVSNHFPQALFLIKNGFDVLCFDYQGYGASEGHPGAKKIVEDGIASIGWAQAHLRPGAQGVVVFGQSLGGAAAIVAAAKEPRVKAAVIESAFSGHAAMTRAVLGRHIWLWPLYPILPLFTNHSMDPIRFVQDIAPRPILFIHGTRDTIVPVSMSKTLFKAAKEPKRLWLVEGGDHLALRQVVGKRYEDEISDFFKQALQKQK